MMRLWVLLTQRWTLKISACVTLHQTICGWVYALTVELNPRAGQAMLLYMRW